MKTIAQITEEYLNRQKSAEYEQITIRSWGIINLYKNVTNYSYYNGKHHFNYIDSNGPHDETIQGELIQQRKKIND